MSELLNALRRNLANREEIGDEETAELLRKRIAKEERAAKKAEAEDPSMDDDVGFPDEVTQTAPETTTKKKGT